jgi:hypothetical protein
MRFNRLSQGQQLKTIIIILIVLFLLNIILISRNRATGYEESIYSNIPVIVWVFLFLSIICGISLITSFTGMDNYRLAGFIILFLNNLLVLMLPVLKGYVFFGRGDPLTHIGIIKDILSYGVFEKDNFYPITHVLFSEIVLIANILPMALFKYMPVFFNMLFMLNMYFFAKTVFKKREHIMIATASGGILLLGNFHSEIIPNGIANFLYPLFIAIFFLSNSKKSPVYNLLLLILIVLLSFLHPLTTVALIFTIVMFKLSLFVMGRLNPDKKRIFGELRQRATNPLLLTIIIFVAWISTFVVWGQTVRSIFKWLWGEVTTTPINAMVSDLIKIDIGGIDFLELYLKLYGHLLILIILSTIASLMIIKKTIHREYQYQHLFSLVSIFIGFILFLVWLLIVPMGFGALRMLAYLAIIVMILGSVGMYELIKNNTKKYMASLAILIILTVCFCIGIFNVFDSPYILKPNAQVTQAEIDGYKWTFDNKNPGIAVSAFMSEQPYRFVDALWGVKARINRSDVKAYGIGPEGVIPDHFNYTNQTALGSSYSHDKYILISEYDRHVYTGVWKAVGRYNNSDFERIMYDPTMQKIYSNGEFDTWIVKSLH